MKSSQRWRIGLLVLSTRAPLWTAAAHGQEQPAQPAPQPESPENPAAPPTTPEQPQQPTIDLSQIPVQVRLGLRVEAVRRQVPVSPTLVIVDSPGGYVEQIGKWSLNLRWPVLIDDGSTLAAENIARFTRAFEPKAVYRASSKEQWPSDATGVRERVERAACAAWGASNHDELRAAWKKLDFSPPGVVVTTEEDPAWTAGLALAAGHGQELLWLKIDRGSITNVVTAEAARDLATRIERAVAELPFTWRALGDEIDAVTLCAGVPGRISTTAGEMATTDRIGRFDSGERWAWCGMVFGDEAAAAYRAMGSLFVQPRSAWLFDGYKADFAPPFRIAPAAELLTRAGLQTTSAAMGRTGIDDWRAAVRRGVRGGIVQVNSAGMPESFNLNPGAANYADVPMLLEPSVVHFIHSFSAQRPDHADTIAGRFLMNGAFAYIGSMNEPYLGAFQPPEKFTTRLLSQCPIGIAGRLDGFKLWKITVIGDPLWTLGPRASRAGAPLDRGEMRSVEDEMRDGLREKNYAQAARALVMLGRDADALRIGKAVHKDEPRALTPELAGILVPVAFREGDAAALLDFFETAEAGNKSDWLAVDLLWQSAREVLPTTEDERLVYALRRHCRKSLLAEDGDDLAPVISRIYGVEAARSFLASLMDQAKGDHEKQQIGKVQQKY